MESEILVKIIDDYKSYREVVKNSIKNFLNEIILYQNDIEKNKDKKALNQDERDEDLMEWIKYSEKFFISKWISEDDLKGIDIDEKFNDEILWIRDTKTESIILFPVYLWDINSKNDNLYSVRLDILKYLVNKKIIRISNFNIIKELNKINKWDVDEELLEISKDLFNISKNRLVDKFWPEEADEKLDKAVWKEKYLQYIIFEKKNITKLLQLLIDSEIMEFKYYNRALFYWWKPIYPQTEFSDRSIFIELFFSKQKLTYFSLKEIYQYLEWWDDNYLNEKQSKKIYNLKDKINSRILRETWIKNFFSLWKWDNKGKICRNY